MQLRRRVCSVIKGGCNSSDLAMAENTKSPEVLQAQRNPDQPGDTRCTRNDGKVWRCKKPRVEGNRFCESHVKTINGGASKAPKRRHSTSDIAPPEKKPRRSSGLGTNGAHGESDDSQERSLEGKAGGEDSPLRMRRRVVHPPSKDGILPSRRKTISGEITISETKEKVMHLNGNRRDTPRKTDKKEVERGSEKKPLKVYKKEISTNGKAGNGHSSQKIVKREEKVYIESSSDGDSDVSLEKQVTRGCRPKEVRGWSLQ